MIAAEDDCGLQRLGRTMIY